MLREPIQSRGQIGFRGIEAFDRESKPSYKENEDVVRSRKASKAGQVESNDFVRYVMEFRIEQVSEVLPNPRLITRSKSVFH